MFARIASISGLRMMALNGQTFAGVNAGFSGGRLLRQGKVFQSDRLAWRRSVLQHTPVLLPNCLWLNQRLRLGLHELVAVVVLALQNEVQTVSRGLRVVNGYLLPCAG